MAESRSNSSRSLNRSSSKKKVDAIPANVSSASSTSSTASAKEKAAQALRLGNDSSHQEVTSSLSNNSSSGGGTAGGGSAPAALQTQPSLRVQDLYKTSSFSSKSHTGHHSTGQSRRLHPAHQPKQHHHHTAFMELPSGEFSVHMTDLTRDVSDITFRESDIYQAHQFSHNNNSYNNSNHTNISWPRSSELSDPSQLEKIKSLYHNEDDDASSSHQHPSEHNVAEETEQDVLSEEANIKQVSNLYADDDDEDDATSLQKKASHRSLRSSASSNSSQQPKSHSSLYDDEEDEVKIRPTPPLDNPVYQPHQHAPNHEAMHAAHPPVTDTSGAPMPKHFLTPVQEQRKHHTTTQGSSSAAASSVLYEQEEEEEEEEESESEVEVSEEADDDNSFDDETTIPDEEPTVLTQSQPDDLFTTFPVGPPVENLYDEEDDDEDEHQDHPSGSDQPVERCFVAI